MAACTTGAWVWPEAGAACGTASGACAAGDAPCLGPIPSCHQHTFAKQDQSISRRTCHTSSLGVSRAPARPGSRTGLDEQEHGNGPDNRLKLLHDALVLCWRCRSRPDSLCSGLCHLVEHKDGYRDKTWKRVEGERGGWVDVLKHVLSAQPPRTEPSPTHRLLSFPRPTFRLCTVLLPFTQCAYKIRNEILIDPS